jgi:hypothetical protein
VAQDRGESFAILGFLRSIRSSGAGREDEIKSFCPPITTSRFHVAKMRSTVSAAHPLIDGSGERAGIRHRGDQMNSRSSSTQQKPRRSARALGTPEKLDATSRLLAKKAHE